MPFAQKLMESCTEALDLIILFVIDLIRRKIMKKYFFRILILCGFLLLAINVYTQDMNSYQSIAGTKWIYFDDDDDDVYIAQIHFRNDGTLVFIDNGGEENIGRWRQKNNTLEFSVNEYSTYIGTIIKFNVIEGSARNQDNYTWIFQLRKWILY